MKKVSYGPDNMYNKKYGQYALDRNYKVYLELMRRAAGWHKTRLYRTA
jgi:hypothetical protein